MISILFCFYHETDKGWSENKIEMGGLKYNVPEYFAVRQRNRKTKLQRKAILYKSRLFSLK